MKFIETFLKGAFIIELEPFSDDRGFFARTYCKREFAAIGHTKEFVQFNHSMTFDKGTLRGMHYQIPPNTEINFSSILWSHFICQKPEDDLCTRGIRPWISNTG